MPPSPWRLAVPAVLGLLVLPAAQTAERTLALTVLERSGDPIRDLTTEDFAITEGGDPRTVVRAGLSTEPLFVVLVVDTTQPPGQVRQVIDERDALKRFMSVVREMNPDGKTAMIVSAGSALRTVGFDAPASEVDAAIQALAPTQQVESSVVEAVGQAARMIGEAPSPHRAIVCLDLDSVDPAGVTVEEAAAAVEKSGAAFWSVSVRTSGHASARRETLLNYLPPRTGGLRRTTILSQPLPDMLRRLARTLSSQYLVTYHRPAGAPMTAIVPRVRRGATILMSPWIR